MKGIKVLLGLSITAVGISAVSLGVASSNKTSLNTVTAAAPTNQRRIWIVNNDNWWKENNYGAEVSNGSQTVVTSKVEIILSDYYPGGLGFVDVTIPNATSALTVRILNDVTDTEHGNYKQTVELNLPAFGGADVIWMNSGETWDSVHEWNDRNASVGTTNGFSGDQLGVILSKFDTCSSATTNGYNAFPQLKTNMFDKTASGAFDTYVYGQSTYTCRDYADAMSERHEANK